MCAGRGRSSGIRPTLNRFKSCLDFCTRNVAPVTRRLSRGRFSSASNKRNLSMSAENVKEIVKEKYGNAALRVTSGDGNPCCGQDRSGLDGASPITSNLYDAAEQGEVPDTAIKASLGCGNPTALAELKLGEVVLDLGSGGGIDVLLSARRVGPKGKAFGLDMTDEMLALAEENKRKSGLNNVQFPER